MILIISSILRIVNKLTLSLAIARKKKSSDLQFHEKKVTIIWSSRRNPVKEIANNFLKPCKRSYKQLLIEGQVNKENK